LHGPRANHSYKECCQNPRNQAESKLRTNYNGNKRALNSHHQDSHAHNNRYLISDNKLRGDSCTPMPSNGKVSASVKSKVADDNYHLSLDGKCPH
jgi:hypothetical protein